MHAIMTSMTLNAPARRAEVVLQKAQQRGVLVLGRLTLPLRQSLEGCRRCGGRYSERLVPARKWQ